MKVANDVTLDYLDAEDVEIQTQHYAFLVSEKGETYRFNGGRGLYFDG